jgi:hypothetical protein
MEFHDRRTGWRTMMGSPALISEGGRSWELEGAGGEVASERGRRHAGAGGGRGARARAFCRPPRAAWVTGGGGGRGRALVGGGRR